MNKPIPIPANLNPPCSRREDGDGNAVFQGQGGSFVVQHRGAGAYLIFAEDTRGEPLAHLPGQADPSGAELIARNLARGFC